MLRCRVLGHVYLSHGLIGVCLPFWTGKDLVSTLNYLIMAIASLMHEWMIEVRIHLFDNLQWLASSKIPSRLKR